MKGAEVPEHDSRRAFRVMSAAGTYNGCMAQIRIVLLSLAVAGLARTAGAAEKNTPNSQKQQDATIVTLSGCVSADSTRPGRFTLSETAPGTAYRLVGLNLREYAGRRVEVSGTTPRRLRISGGLYPSPNVAAQAGAIDPSQAAIAATESAAKPVQEFRVRSVRLIPGECSQR